MNANEKWCITAKQKAILDSLVCERLSANQNGNVAILHGFKGAPSERVGPLLHLKNDGISDDKSNSVAVYVIKTKQDEGLFAFSLKCGELYDRDSKEFNATQALKKAFFDNAEISNLPEKEQIILFLKLCHAKKIDETIAKKAIKMQKDLLSSAQGQVNHVSKTFSGILLVDFCKNFSANDVWNKLGIGVDRPMGEVLFWRFIAPLILKVSKLVGCEYLFLYAADLTEDESLINYYSEALNFQREKTFGVNKPVYDLLCPLMSQRIIDMQRQRKRYFQTFNMKPEDDSE